MIEFAVEADPGRLTASFPTYETWDEAYRVAICSAFTRPGLPDARVLVRIDSGPWQVAP